MHVLRNFRVFLGPALLGSLALGHTVNYTMKTSLVATRELLLSDLDSTVKQVNL